jgi:non-ribosomal peptide synthetase component E (peptide arylation enzyme)
LLKSFICGRGRVVNYDPSISKSSTLTPSYAAVNKGLGFKSSERLFLKLFNAAEFLVVLLSFYHCQAVAVLLFFGRKTKYVREEFKLTCSGLCDKTAL